MKKQFVCVLLALALGMGLSPALAAEGDMALAVAGVPEDSPYLVWGELTATVEDYVEAVARVGNGLLVACAQREVPFQGRTLDMGLMGGGSVNVGGAFHWDNTIDGVPFDQYLEEGARVLAFYRAWSESSLAPRSTAESFEAWSRESGWLRFFYFPVDGEEEAWAVYEALCRGEDREALWGAYSVSPEGEMEYAGEPELFLPEVIRALEEAPLGLWQEPVLVDGGERSHWAVVQRLSLTPEVHRQALLEEAWPGAVKSEEVRIAEGAEELEAAALYEKWLAWAVACGETIASDRWTTVDSGAVILPAGEVREETGFVDVSAGDWFAPYVEVCVEEGLMAGTGEGRFEPRRELTAMEVLALEAKLGARVRGEAVPSFPALSELAVLYDGNGERLGTIEDCIYEPKVYYGYNTLYFALPPELQARAGEGKVSLVVDVGALEEWPLDPLAAYRPLPEEAVRYEGGWDSFRSCYTIDFGEDFDGQAEEVLKELDGLMEQEKGLEGRWFRDAVLYNRCLGDLGLLSARHEGPGDLGERMGWLQEEPALRGDVLGLMEAMEFWQHEGLWWEMVDQWDELDWEDVYLQGLRELGILNGIDEAGTMAPEGHLTRGEVAAVLARTLRPQLRAEKGDYALTPVELGDWQVRGVAADWLALGRERLDGTLEGAIYRADGKILDLEGGFVWMDGRAALGHTVLAPVRRGEQWGVYDVETEKFVLPYTGWEEFYVWEWDQQGTPRPRQDRKSGLWGYMDRTDTWAIPPQYEEAEDFRDGWAKVELSDGTEAVIDTQGEVLIKGGSLENLGDGLFLFWEPNISGGYFINEDLERTNLDPVKDRVWGNLVRGRAVWSEAGNGYLVVEDRYYSYEGEALTPWFECAGPVDDEGCGFVVDWGRVYRIRFQEEV